VATLVRLARRARSVVLLLAAVAAIALTANAGGTAPAPRTTELVFHSRGLEGPLRLRVYLPDDYDTASTRYPVVYFLHGLPAGSGAFRDLRWMPTRRPRAIIVAPQGAKDDDKDPEYLDWGRGRRWQTALTRELQGFIDKHFRTIPNRSGRALLGLSAGGYGAANLGVHHLDRFSVIESWSGYFHPTNPSGTARLDLGSAERNADASVHSFIRALRRDMDRRPTFFAFYVGSNDGRFRKENEELHRELSAAHVRHVFAIYRGAHESSVWRGHSQHWFQLAVDHLARPR
jgi:enterochelin esterase-like enzyme